MKSIIALIGITILGFVGPGLVVSPALGQGKMLVGWVEKVRISPGNLLIRGKLDSGAKTCSLNAPHFTEFSRDGEKWVRFDVTNKYGERVTLERKVTRVATIKEHGGELQQRPVIQLGICLAHVYKEVEVNLVDRGKFIYPMLIGRTFMAGDFIIDPSGKYTTTPACKETGQP